jgi:hypothetical protein
MGEYLGSQLQLFGMVELKETDFYIVLVGIDGTEPPKQIIRNCQNAIKSDIADSFNLSLDDVYIRGGSEESHHNQMDKLGDKTIHIQQYDIGMRIDSTYSIDNIENIVRERLECLGFNTTGTESKKIKDKQFPRMD